MARRLLLLTLAVVLVGCSRFQTRRDELAARSAAPSDDSKPLRDRVQQKREERKTGKDAPKLPSAVAPKEAAPAKPDDLATVRRLYTVAAARYDSLTDFEARLTRREVVKGKDTPQEEMLYQFRKTPLSVYMKQTVEKGFGKEVLYVQGQHENKMHVLIGTAEGNFLMKAGSVQKFAPDNPLVTSRSRRRIDEAGFGEAVGKFGKLIELTASGARPDGVRYLGPTTRAEYPYPLEAIEIRFQPGDDPLLPKGGSKTAFLDMKQGSPGYGVPVVLMTLDDTGREVEYYCFDRIRTPAGLTDAHFHPDRLGKQ